MDAYFSTLVDDPAFANLLWDVEGATEVYAIPLPLNHYLIGAKAPGCDPVAFNRACAAVLRDAERVNQMLESCPDLVLDW